MTSQDNSVTKPHCTYLQRRNYPGWHQGRLLSVPCFVEHILKPYIWVLVIDWELLRAQSFLGLHGLPRKAWLFREPKPIAFDQVAFTFIQANAAEKLQRSMELLAIIRAKPKEPEPEPEPEPEDDSLLPGLETTPKKKASTLVLPSAEDMEHRALQAAVLHQWEMFRSQQLVQ